LQAYINRVVVTLLQVKNYEGDVEELGLVFVVEEEHLGVRTEFPLMPNGADQPVTEANKLLYVHLAARWHIVRVNGRAVSLFAHGLSQVQNFSDAMFDFGCLCLLGPAKCRIVCVKHLWL
jgi:hypothetical protein